MRHFGIILFGLLVCRCIGQDFENITAIRAWTKNNCKLELPPMNISTDTFSEITYWYFPYFPIIPKLKFKCTNFTICKWTFHFDVEKIVYYDHNKYPETKYCISTHPNRVQGRESQPMENISGKTISVVVSGGDDFDGDDISSNNIFHLLPHNRTSEPNLRGVDNHGHSLSRSEASNSLIIDQSSVISPLIQSTLHGVIPTDVRNVLKYGDKDVNKLRCPDEHLCKKSIISVKRKIYWNFATLHKLKPPKLYNNTIYTWNYMFMDEYLHGSLNRQNVSLEVELNTDDLNTSCSSLLPEDIQKTFKIFKRHSKDIQNINVVTNHPRKKLNWEGIYISRSILKDNNSEYCKGLYFGQFKRRTTTGPRLNVTWIDAGKKGPTKKNATELTTLAPGKEVTTKETTTELTTLISEKKGNKRPVIGNGSAIKLNIPAYVAKRHLAKTKALLLYQLENNEKISGADFENVLKVYNGIWKSDTVAKNKSSHKQYGSNISQQLNQYTQILNTNEIFKLSTELFEIEVRPMKKINHFQPLHYNTSSIDAIIPYEVFNFPSNPTSRQAENNSSITDSSGVSFVFYPTAEFFVSEENVLNVLSIEVGREVANLTQPIQITHGDINVTDGLKTPNPKNALLAIKKKLVCANWDYDAQVWSEDGGCLDTSASKPTCQYTHLSSFAMLIRNEYVPNDVALSVASTIGLSFSIACLLLTVVVHLLNRKAMKVRYTKIFLHICGNMVVAYFFFVIGMTQIQNKLACKILAILSHYFFLSTWFWKSAYSYEIYQSFVEVFVESKPKYMQKLAVFGYVIPGIIVAVTVTVTHVTAVTDSSVCDSGANTFALGYYLAENVCWISGDVLKFSFLLPLGILLVWNCAVLARVVWELKQNKSGNSVCDKAEGRQHTAICITFAMTIGVSWTTGGMILFSTDPTYHRVMSWIFTITTSSQGLLIFFFAVVRRRNLWEPVMEQRFNFSRAKQSWYDSTESSGIHSSRTTTQFNSKI